MKITIESTTKIVRITIGGDTVPARIWEGHTDSGIPVHCFVTRIAAPTDENLEQFDAELQECRSPSEAISTIPMRMIL